MDEKNIFKLNFNKNKENGGSEKEENRSFSLHTNPIVQKNLIDNAANKKSKFSIKDLFR